MRGALILMWCSVVQHNFSVLVICRRKKNKGAVLSGECFLNWCCIFWNEKMAGGVALCGMEKCGTPQALSFATTLMFQTEKLNRGKTTERVNTQERLFTICIYQNYKTFLI